MFVSSFPPRAIPIAPLSPTVKLETSIDEALAIAQSSRRSVLFAIEPIGNGAHGSPVRLLGTVSLADLLMRLNAGERANGAGDRARAFARNGTNPRANRLENLCVRDLVKPVDRVVRVADLEDGAAAIDQLCASGAEFLPAIGEAGECLGTIDVWQWLDGWRARDADSASAAGSMTIDAIDAIPDVRSAANAQQDRYRQTIASLRADIDDYQLLERKLASSYTQMQALFDVMKDVAAIVSTSDGSFDVNILSASLFEDPTRVAIVDRTIAALLDDSAPNPLHQSIQEALDTDRTVECDYEFEIDGRPLYFEALVSPISDTSILWLARNITELKNTAQALRASQRRFRYLLTSNPAVVYTCALDDRAHTTFIGDNIRDLLGYDAEAWTENPEFFRSRLHPDDRESIAAAFATVRERGHAIVEYRCRHADDTYRWLSDELKLATAADNLNPIECIGSLTDISARKRAETEVFHALEKERELNELKSRFVSIASHEFRTPLAIIQSSAQLLERYELDPNERQEQFAQIHDSIQHMNQLLTDVLTLGRAEAGKIEFQPEPVSVQFFCQNLIERLQVVNTSHQIALAFDDRIDNATRFDLDVKLLRQILTNLISNAVKYSPEADRVDLGVAIDPDGALRLEVRDRGIGIPPSDLPRLCSSFHRAGNVGTIQGTGLGLAIVQRCVSLHGGTIDFKSQVDRGTTAVVRLPSPLQSSP